MSGSNPRGTEHLPTVTAGYFVTAKDPLEVRVDGMDGIDGIDGIDVVFPECVAKDSRLALEVWRLESQPCSSDRRVPATRSLSIIIGRNSQNVIGMMCSLQIAWICCVL